MDQSRINAIRARCEAATPGPWKLTKDGRYEDHDECRIDLPDDNIELCRYENGEFIAHARTDIPDLIAEVERLRAELEAAKRDIQDMLQQDELEGVCVYCKHIMRETCGGCHDADWRGLCAENGGANGRVN